jgi:hypothetical protein
MFINIDPDETVYENLSIDNIGGENINIVIDLNYISGSNWIWFFPPLSFQMEPGSTVSLNIPFCSNGLVNTTVEAEFIIVNSLGPDIIVPVVMEVNPFPTLDPPQNLYVDCFGYATWDSPAVLENRDLMGYNIYLDDCLLSFTNTCFWQLIGLIPGQTYNFGISAIYDEGESNIAYFNFYYYPFLNPIQNLYIDSFGYATWEPPDSMSESREFLGYNVFLDEDFITFTTDEYYDYEQNNLIPGDLYVGSVTAVYDEGESTTEWQAFIYAYFEPPVNLQFEELTCTLSWEEPTPSNFELNSYNIYLDNVFVGNTCDTEWQYYNLIINNSYIAGVQAVYDEGTSEITTIEFSYYTAVMDNFIHSSMIMNIYPNPFNPSTTISFNVTHSSDFATIEIYNMRGQKVKTYPVILSGVEGSNHSFTQSQNQQIIWNGTDDDGRPVASGVYYCKLKSGEHQAVRKLVLMK